MTKNEKTTDTQSDEEFFLQFDQLITQINLVKSQMSGIQQNIKSLEKCVKKQMRNFAFIQPHV